MKWEILNKLKGNEVVDALLDNRGIKTKKQKKEFLDPKDPLKISLKEVGVNEKEITKAIARIKKAKKTGEKVIVYGDYDADGICATAILWETLYSLGLNVLPYIPERFSEGYGLNSESIKRLKTNDEKLGLIITVDHGIVADKKVDLAKELGIDVIITDHHLPGKIKPKSCALIHTTKISGSAIAWILARELAANSSLDLVSIGTIADQIPLVGINRSFVKFGLEALNKTKRVGLLALMKEAGLEVGLAPRSVYEVGFIIAPRINATGRIEHGIDSLRLLCTNNRNKARELAHYLGETNSKRQKIVEEVVSHAKSRVTAVSSSKVIVLAHESYHEGVIGLAAGKLVEEFYRPAIVLSKKKEISKASARSISGFNIIEAIRSVGDLIIEGGGHPMAAGFSIKTEHLEAFSQKINEMAEPLLTDDILSRKLRIDLELDFNQINYELLKIIKSFEPTGLGNPTPTFATKNVEVLNARVVGRNSKHLKLRLNQDSCTFDAVAFGFGSLYSKLSPDKPISIAYTLDEDTWNGNKKLQLKIKDIRVLLVKRQP